MRSGGLLPPPLKRGISAILARYTMKTRQIGAIPPSEILSRKGIARHGGVSRIGPLSLSNAQANSAQQLRDQGSRAAKRGVFKQGGFPDLDLSFLFCSFLDFPDFFRDFPDLLRDGPGIFPICPFSVSRPIESTYEEQSRKGPRHNLDLCRKKWETPRFGNPPV